MTRAHFFFRLYISLAKRSVFPLFVSWWRLNFWWKHVWKVRERRGSRLKLRNITNHQERGAPVCNSPADGMDRQTKMYLYSLPSVLAKFHWCKSAWGALLCSPISVPGRVVAWEVPGRCVDVDPPARWFVLPARAASEEPVCTLLLKDYPQCSTAGWIYLSSHALVTAICLADSFAVSIYSSHERSLDQGPWFYYVFVNHLAAWVSRSMLGPTESIAFPGMPVIVIHCKPNPFLTLCCRRHVSPCVAWEQGSLQSCLYFHQVYYYSFTLLMWCSYNVQLFSELNICYKHLHTDLWKNLDVSWVR